MSATEHATEVEQLIDRVDSVVGNALSVIEDADKETRAREIRDEVTELLEELQAIVTVDVDSA